MGGKGWRRREKNYRAAHGGYSRLPPPPDYSQGDALPSKLRKILSFTKTPESQVSLKLSKDAKQQKKRDGVSGAQLKPEDEVDLETSVNDGGDDEHLAAQHKDEKKKKKRKRKHVQDLRFEAEAMGESEARLKRKERKKKYFEARKNKHKKGKKEETSDFPGREKIRFGEVVQAPPKLVSVPKALKNVQDPSKERVRFKAIEEYRKRKGWNSRPGIQLPPPVTASEL